MSSRRSKVYRGLRTGRRSLPAFTLTELLIVILVIAILLALLIGGINQGRECAYDVQCKTNLNKLYQALHFGKESRLPRPDCWVGLIDTTAVSSALLCPVGDSDVLPPRNPYPPGVDLGGDEASLPPLSTPPPLEQNVVFVNPSSDLTQRAPGAGALESNTVLYMFTERKNYKLPSNVLVDVTAPGTVNSAGTCSPGTIPAGTVVYCHMLHFDPITSGVVTGSASFTRPVLGLIVLTASLAASDDILGYPGTTYSKPSPPARGMELGRPDTITLSADKKTVIINVFGASAPGDQVRILVDASSSGGGGVIGGVSGALALPEVEDEDYGPGGPTSYAMNNQATPLGVWPGQVLLVEYHRALADYDGQGADDNFSLLIAPRHLGHVNVLFGDGQVRSMTPEELDPAVYPAIWKPRSVSTSP